MPGLRRRSTPARAARASARSRTSWRRSRTARPWRDVPGLTWRDGERVVRNPPAAVRGREPLPARRLRPASTSSATSTSAACAGSTTARARAARSSARSAPTRRSTSSAGAGSSRSAWWREIAEQAARHRLDRGLLQRRQLLHRPAAHRSDLPGPAGRAACGVRWFGTGRADLLRRLTDDQLALLRESGCYKINVGAESGSPELLRQIKKGTLVEEVLETAEKLHRVGIGARFSFIAGFPQEPAGSLAETYRTVKALREIDGGFETPIYFYAPYPGTELAERMPALGFETPQQPRGLARRGPRPLDRALDLRARCASGCRATTSISATATSARGARWSRRLLHRVARARARRDFYALDVERRAVDLWQAAAHGPRPPAAGDRGGLARHERGASRPFLPFLLLGRGGAAAGPHPPGGAARGARLRRPDRRLRGERRLRGRGRLASARARCAWASAWSRVR